ncbi:MAG: hypothetical protein Q9169_003831 [Polycauliona sp. 2 TL-2023]
MRWQHTLVWSCQAPRHTDLQFDTSEECEMHMRREHSEDISIDQLSLLVEKSAHPAADPIDVLVRSEKDGPEDRSVCPLCPFATGNSRAPEPLSLVPNASASAEAGKLMRDHVAEHLESIALLSLPEQEVDDAASDEVQSESARLSSHGEHRDLDPLLQFTSDEWDTYNTAMVQAGLESFDIAQDTLPPCEYVDWSYVTASQVEIMCNKLDLPKDVTVFAEHMVTIAQADKTFRGESSASIIVGCIFIACRQRGVGHTILEIVETLQTSTLVVTAILNKLELLIENRDVYNAAISTFDPGRDPVLIPFVERARRIQTAETQKRLGIPLIVISDPDGLEIPEARWADRPEQLQAKTASATQRENVEPRSSVKDNRTTKKAMKKRMQNIQEANVETKVHDPMPSAASGPRRGIPEITMSEY